MRRFATKYLQNVRLFLILFMSLIIGGLLSFFQTPRELSPTIEIPMLAVSAVYPGASAEDVEELVTNKIETALKSVKGIKEVTSSSSDNSAIAIIQFDDQTNLDDAYNRVVQKMGQILDLPDSVETPTVFKIDFDDTPIWVFNLEGPDPAGLAEMSDRLSEEIEQQALIDRVDVSGNSEREIQLLLNQEKTNQLGLNPQVIIQALAGHLNNLPAGTVQLDTYQFSVSIDRHITDLESLRQTPLKINGQTYILGDLMAVSENDKPGATQSFQLTDGQLKQTTSMAVYKMAGQPIDRATNDAKTSAENYLASYPEYSITTVLDIGEEIATTFSDLTLNFGATIVLVFIVMLLFIGAREALVAAACIPTVMFASFIYMNFTGMSLNMISLMSLLLALGLLVDNAIVVVTALNRTYRQAQGELSALQSAVIVWEEFFSALISTNLTTVWAFLPLLLMTGIMGDYLAPLPIIVTVAIIGSALVAFFISLPLGVLILDAKIPTRVQKLLIGFVIILLVTGVIVFLPSSPFAYLAAILIILVAFFAFRAYKVHRQRHPAKKMGWIKFKRGLSQGFISITYLENIYQRLLTKLLNNPKLRRRVLVMVVAITVLSFILPFTPLIKTEFMPTEESNIIYLDVELPVGSNSQYTSSKMLELLNDFQDYSYAKNISASLGSGSMGMSGIGQSNDHLFQLTLEIDEDLKNVPSASQIASDLRHQYQDYQFGKLTVTQDQGDMSQMGSAVQVSLMGPDQEQLAVYAEEVATYLRQIPGTTNVQTSSQENPSQIIFVPNNQLLLDTGLSTLEINQQLRTLLNGQNLGTLKLNSQEYDLTFRFQSEQPNFTDLEKLMVTTSRGATVPLATLGEFVLQPNLGTIDHQSYQLVNTITADTLPGFSGTEINSQLNKFIEEMDLPAEYGLATGGMNEIFAESMQSLGIAMIIAFFLILFTLVLQLQSFRQAVIVMTAIPVSICGVFLLFALAGITLSITSVIGILALFGIVVNNSILIIERINQNLTAGQQFKPAIISGATSRLQPIIMTSLTTIIGLLPISIIDVMWRGLGGAIISGLIFSGVLLLIFIPILYYNTFNQAKLDQKDQKWLALKKKFLT